VGDAFKRNQNRTRTLLEARTEEALEQVLGAALTTVTPEDASGCFQHCGEARPN